MARRWCYVCEIESRDLLGQIVRYWETVERVSVLERDVCVWEDGELSVGHVGSRDGRLAKVRQEQRLNVNNTYLRLTNTH